MRIHCLTIYAVDSAIDCYRAFEQLGALVI